MTLKEKIRKYKIKAKKFYTVILLTIVEMFIILWACNWVLTVAIMAPLVQFVAIFENRKGWSKLSEEEKKELTLTEEELTNFIKVVAEKLDYMTTEEIIQELKIKED